MSNARTDFAHVFNHLDVYLRPNKKLSDEEKFSVSTVRRVKESLGKCLQARAEELPRTGGVQAFIHGAELCLVCRYEMSAGYVMTEALAAIKRPRSVSDVWDLALSLPARERSLLRSLVTTSHKVVWIDGILIHVDRILNKEVFGPSIDTIVLAGVLPDVLGKATLPNHCLEIGSGSGLLTALLSAYLPESSHVSAIEASADAASATIGNVEATLKLKSPIAAKVSVSWSYYDPAGDQKTYDLIICNPPYVPLIGATGNHHHEPATIGTKLLLALIDSSQKLLNEGGSVLLMTSSVCAKEVKSACNLLKKIRVTWPLGTAGYTAAFDVPAALEDQGWLDRMVAAEGLSRADDGSFTHVLHPLVLTKIKP